MQIACNILHGFALLFSLTNIAFDLRKPIKENPVALYDLALHVFQALCILLWIRICWRKTKGLRNLMKTCHEDVIGKLDKISLKVISVSQILTLSLLLDNRLQFLETQSSHWFLLVKHRRKHNAFLSF